MMAHVRGTRANFVSSSSDVIDQASGLWCASWTDGLSGQSASGRKSQWVTKMGERLKTDIVYIICASHIEDGRRVGNGRELVMHETFKQIRNI